MAIRSETFPVRKASGEGQQAGARVLQDRHRTAIERVVREARILAEDRRRDLAEITDGDLQRSATR